MKNICRCFLLKEHYKLVSLILMVSFLSGCFLTSQSFNHGKLLNPGESLSTASVAYKPYTRIGTDYVYRGDSSFFAIDSMVYNWTNLCIDYRLGFLEKYPFGKGVEIGFHFELMLSSRIVTNDYSGYSDQFYGYRDTFKETMALPPTMELSARFGIKDITLNNSIYHHNIGLGWIIGFWIDNGWLIEYAGSLEFRHIMPYASCRFFLIPTNTIDRLENGSFDESGFDWSHDQNPNMRLCLGASVKLPQRIRFLPDFISPEVSVVFPNYSFVKHAGLSFGLGLRWMGGI